MNLKKKIKWYCFTARSKGAENWSHAVDVRPRGFAHTEDLVLLVNVLLSKRRNHCERRMYYEPYYIHMRYSNHTILQTALFLSVTHLLSRTILWHDLCGFKEIWSPLTCWESLGIHMELMGKTETESIQSFWETMPTGLGERSNGVWLRWSNTM